MAERYLRVYTQRERLCCPGAPVIIEAGALLKDNQTGRIIAQLKFMNISPKEIRALTVGIDAKDMTGMPLRGVDQFQYLDLHVGRDEEFGAKTPIVLPDVVTRSFSCRCLSAVFGDGTTWVCDKSAVWTVFPGAMTLESQLGNVLAKQYRRDTNPKAEYVPQESGDLWSCACGTMNNTSETVCHSCSGAKAALFGALNVDILRSNSRQYNQRVAAQRATAAEAERARRTKKVITGLIAAIGIVLILLAALLITKVIIPGNDYKKATALFDRGEYIAAGEAFTALEDYKDSEAMALKCRYQYALQLMEDGAYGEAYEVLEALGAYPGAAEKILEGKHAELVECLDRGDTDGARDLAQELRDREQTQEYLLHLILTAIDGDDYEAAFMLAELLCDGSSWEEQAKEALYQRAVEYYSQKAFDSANPIFVWLGQYKDSRERIHHHTYVNTVLREATCSSEGKMESRCSCGSATETTIPMLSHRFEAATCVKPQTCVDCGATEGTTLAHNFAAATCTAPKKCADCGFTEGTALGHAAEDLFCSRCKTVLITLSQLQGTWKVYCGGQLRDTVTISGSTGTVYDHIYGRTVTGTVEIRKQDVWIRYDAWSAYQTYGIVKCTSTYISDGAFEWIKQ